MIPILALSTREFRRFLFVNNLSENKYFHLTNIEQLYAVERGSILLMFESYQASDNYHELIKLARNRNLDCIKIM